CGRARVFATPMLRVILDTPPPHMDQVCPECQKAASLSSAPLPVLPGTWPSTASPHSPGSALLPGRCHAPLAGRLGNAPPLSRAYAFHAGLGLSHKRQEGLCWPGLRSLSA